MSKKNASNLSSRKPFKVLEQLSEHQLDAIESELQIFKDLKGKPFDKLLTCIQQWRKLYSPDQQLDQASFIEGTRLPKSANAFDKLISKLYRFLQEFLAKMEAVYNPVSLEQLSFQAWCRLDFDWKDLNRRHKEAHRNLDKLPQSSQLLQDRLALDLNLGMNASFRKIPFAERNFSGLLESLQNAYTTQKLRILCAIANDQQIFAGSTLSEENYSLPHYQKDWPLLARLYYGTFLLLTGTQEKDWMATMQKMLNEQNPHSPTYPREDMFDLYGYLLNALSRRVNRGDSDAVRDLSQLYQHLLDSEILLVEGKILAGHFKNVIRVHLKSGEVSLARKVFEQFREKIADDADENVVRYNRTLLLHAEQRLEEAARALEELCMLSGNQKLDQFYGLDMRANLLKVYFELLEKQEDQPAKWDKTEEKLIRLLEAFKGYIERKKLPEDRKKSYEDFRKHLQTLYGLLYAGGPESNQQGWLNFQKAIQDSPESGDSWFLTRIEKGIGG